MAIPERLRLLLVEFADVQMQPISDVALVERMRTEATTWINAVHMQYRRAKLPVVDPEVDGNEPWQLEIDLHFLVVALTRLRRAVGVTAQVTELQYRLLDYLAEFDGSVPSLMTLRNVAEHFDDYTTGRGRVEQIKRHQLQVWSLSEDASEGLVWRWLGMEFSVDSAHRAATVLYRSFLADADGHLAQR